MLSTHKKLIELVKKYPILYDPNHIGYKNNVKKEQVWREIGAELDQEFYIVKKKWKNIKDSYAKHLKTLATPNAHRYKRWPWASQMEPFKPFLPFTSSSTNNGSNTKVNSEECETNSNSSNSELIGKFEITPPKTTITKRKRSTLNLKTPGGSSSAICNKVLEHLKNNPGNRSLQDYDATELIFLGYAKTLKRFSLERQANIKLEFAQILMRHEIENEKDEMMTSATTSNSPEFVNMINTKTEIL